MKISVTRSSICGLVQFHNYNVNKCFCFYLDLALQHLKVSLDRSVICLDDKVENSKFLKNSRNQFSEVFHSEFSVLHCTQNQKLRAENL